MQTMEITSWSDFKSLVSAKGITIQYAIAANCYDIYAPEAQTFLWHISLTIGSDDANDFETNYKATANSSLEIKAGVGRPMRVSASPQPLSTVEHWKGFQITVPAGQTSAYVDITFSSNVYLHGGYIVSPDVDFDDYITLDVLVTANSATYIGGLISNAYLIPNIPVSFESEESMQFPTSLKLRVTLNIGASQATDVHANILVDYFI